MAPLFLRIGFLNGDFKLLHLEVPSHQRRGSPPSRDLVIEVCISHESHHRVKRVDEVGVWVGPSPSHGPVGPQALSGWWGWSGSGVVE